MGDQCPVAPWQRKTMMVYMHPDVSRIKKIIDKRNESKMLQ
jgi:hypothetical protein